jgi:putative sigma-54 modulation protein
MKVAFTGRNLVVTPAMQEFARERLEKLDHWLEGLSEAHVILAKEKYRHIAEVVVTGKNVVLSGTQETEDMYSSIGKALEKVEHQARRHREKHTVAKRRRARKSTNNGSEPEEVVEELVLTTLPGGKHVVQDDTYPHKPMTLEEAALRLEEGERDFLVFREAGSQRFGVLYRRADGNLALILPSE